MSLDATLILYFFPRTTVYIYSTTSCRIFYLFFSMVLAYYVLSKFTTFFRLLYKVNIQLYMKLTSIQLAIYSSSGQASRNWRIMSRSFLVRSGSSTINLSRNLAVMLSGLSSDTCIHNTITVYSHVPKLEMHVGTFI